MGLLGDVQVRIGLDVKDFQQGLTKAENNMKNVGSKIGGIGRNLATKVSLPLVGIGVTATKIGMDFEKSMSKVQAVTQATGGQFQDLEDTARELGRLTQYSANEVADAMGFLGMAGFETNEILASTEDVLNLASVGQLDLATTADIASNMLSGMNLEASEMGRVVDVMATAMTDSNVDVVDLGESFKYVAPIASGLGIGLEDLTASIGLLGDSGMQGSIAGTALSTGLSRLSKPVGDAGKLIEELGMNFFDAEENLKSMPKVIEELEDGLEGMSSKQRQAALSTIFGQDAQKAWGTLISEGSEKLGKFSDDLEDSKGAGETMADIMNDNLIGSLNELTSALSDVAISIFKTLVDPFRTIIEYVTNVVLWIGELDDKIIMLGVALAGIGIIVPILLIVVGGLISGIGTLIGIFASLFSTVNLVIAGIALLVTGLVFAYNSSETFREIVHASFTAIRDVVVEVFTHVYDFIVDTVTDIKDFWDTHGDSIRTAFERVVSAIGSVFRVVFPIIKAIVIDTINNVMGVINGLITFIKGFVKVVTGIINGDWRLAWEGLKDMVLGAVQAVWNFIQLYLLGRVMGVFKSFGGLIGNALKNVGKKMTAPFKKGYNTIKKWIGKIKDTVKNMFNTHIKRPSFSFTGSLNPVDWVTQGLPKLGINWNAKGNIFTGASLLGAGQGVGEAGAEVVMPIQHKRYMRPYAQTVAEILRDMEDDDNGGGSINNNFNISKLVVREDADVKKIAEELEDIQTRKNRAKGKLRFK